MKTPRRFLPSLSLLQAFEAAARLQSITGAAAELSLTQSAVSRQIRALEEQLGTVLFHREKQTIRLTHGGATYAREVREALQKISQASMNLRANPHGGTLSLAILPTFGTRWLAPRLPAFLAANPGITINLVTRLTQFDFSAETVDAAIHFGRTDWPGAAFTYLMGEDVVPACSPAMAARFGFGAPADLRAAPLLHLTSRPDAWEKYFARNGVDAENVHGMLFDQFATAAQAAAAGLGVALLPTFLIEDEIAAGRLVRAFDAPMRSDEAYYLCWPRDQGDYEPLRQFADWLVGEARAFEAARA
ncbi:LysR family transcriptional regulator [Rhodobacter xanthinilyticus]|uniref:LysR family transcriptional regulator n=1 Tax=Rhodobacter xanthinilyticus TaxID=1850250 RepID=A0A1D9M943_9RHOB|nr:LysR family transcriptional regulator [Rhodobacter xanthinilyticus]AOZ68328.1 LysR family transcriptional regulator [Rhodobacter xanthinilyticus]